jgi:hypothetical protein
MIGASVARDGTLQVRPLCSLLTTNESLDQAVSAPSLSGLCTALGRAQH